MLATSLALYVYAITLCIFILVGVTIINSNYEHPDKTNRDFAWNLAIQIAYFIFDIVWVMLEGRPGVPHIVLLIVFTIYFIIGLVCAYSWFILTEDLLSARAFENRKFHFYTAIPMILVTILLIISLFTGWVFTIDDLGYFVRGPLRPAVYIVSGLYLLGSTVLAIRQAAKSRKFEILSRDSALIFFAIPSFIAVILQMFFTGYPLLPGAITFSMVYVYIVLIHDETLYQNAIISDLADDYECILQADIISNQVKVFRGIDFYNTLAEACNGKVTYNHLIFQVANNYIYEEDKELFLNSFSRNHLSVALQLDKAYTVVVRDKIKQSYYQIKVVHPGGDAKSTELMFGIHEADEDIKKEKAIQNELAQAKSAAETANKTKSNFLFNMSHDIRTPMNAILGFTDLARKHINETERVEDCLDKVSTSGSHLLSLINDVLDMSRIESGKVTIEVAPTNMPRAVDGIVSMVTDLAADKNITLMVDVDDITDENVYADVLHVNEVMLNLLSNSIKYTRKGGHVRFSVRQTKSEMNVACYEFVVKDNGMGMSKEFLEHVFDAFEREQNSTISGIQGTGLGMSITKKLVDMMNGTIHVDSTEGIGTTVTVNLDFIVCDAALVSDGNKEEIYEAVTLEGKRILLVDDNELNRELATELLVEAGAEVETAVDGGDAVGVYNLVDPGYFDLILMDVQMPNMNGYEATKAIRAMDDKSKADIPIVAMTANAFQEDIENALASGMNAHLAKPVDVEKLLVTLSTFLEK